MNAGQLIQIVDDAFHDVERPKAFTNGCPCQECADIEAAFELCADKLPEGIAWQLPLLSPEAEQYLMPRLIRESLADADSELASNVIDKFGQLVSKSNRPISLSFSRNFNHAQTTAVLEFLRFVRDHWCSDVDELPRELRRGIVNWEYFAECTARPK